MAQAPEEVKETREKHAESVGRIVQITGPVIDVEFEEGQAPDIFYALEVQDTGRELPVVLEVEQSLGNNWVRTVSMSPTEGLSRGMAVKNTGRAIMVPVGEATLGRVFNVTGNPVDNRGPVAAEDYGEVPKRLHAFQRAQIVAHVSFWWID